MALKDLHSLIRIRKWDVDEKQRALAVLLRSEEQILEAQDALAAEMKAELAFVASAPPEQRTTFAPYLERCDMRKENLAGALAEVRKQADEARDELAEAFRRLKTFEITQEQREDAEEAEENRLETIELNEIGLTLHRRKA